MNMMRDTFNTIHAIYSTQIFEMIMKTTQKVRIVNKKSSFFLSVYILITINYCTSTVWFGKQQKHAEGEEEEKNYTTMKKKINKNAQKKMKMRAKNWRQVLEEFHA